MSKEKVQVPFELSKQVKALGITNNQKLYSFEINEKDPNFEKAKTLTEKAEAFKRVATKPLFSDMILKNYPNNQNIRNDRKIVEENASVEIVPFVTAKFNWGFLLENREDWDILEFLDLIRTYGMPSDKNHRINMLNNLASKFENQLYVPYPQMLEYNEAFRETYNWDVVASILKAGKITGGNFSSSLYFAVEKGLIDKEQANLLNYVFPIAISQDVVMVKELADNFHTYAKGLNREIEMDCEM